METSQAFRHLRTLIRAASETDSTVLIHEQLKMMIVVIDKATTPAKIQKVLDSPITKMPHHPEG
jgi:RecA/RadA recombinase